MLVLDLLLDIIDGIRRLDFKRDGFASQGLDEDLHASAKAKHQVKRRLLLDVVVRKSTTVLKLFASKNQALLVRRNAFLVLDFLLRFHIHNIKS